jgi:hypothetical protein
MLNIIIQVILGLFLILIMAFIAYSIYDREYINSLSIFNTNKRETKIFTGIYPYTKDGIRVETFNRSDPYYYDLNPSVNQNGGAEYSYNFWLYFNIKSDDKIVTKTSDNAATITQKKYIVLFYKGVKQLIPYKQFGYSCDTAMGSETSDDGKKNYILVKNPLVKINNDGKEIIIEYNNINTPDTFNSSAVKLTCDTTDIYASNKNKLGIKNIDTKMFNKMYNMITVVLQESPLNEEALFTNRTNCKVYFNGSLISDRSTYNNDITTNDEITTIVDKKSTVMKKNMGNLYINPAANLTDASADYITKIHEIIEEDDITKDAPLKMANLSYYNYALNVDEIYKLYNKGFSKELADIIVKHDNTIKNNVLTGNKINFDIYNSAENDKIPVESI